MSKREREDIEAIRSQHRATPKGMAFDEIAHAAWLKGHAKGYRRALSDELEAARIRLAPGSEVPEPTATGIVVHIRGADLSSVREAQKQEASWTARQARPSTRLSRFLRFAAGEIERRKDGSR